MYVNVTKQINHLPRAHIKIRKQIKTVTITNDEIDLEKSKVVAGA